ncbi:MAG: DUF2974 domain-containing protein [Erysipelotrichaceae bacterium]|nr:DUF2974 domain-containing protein [Erysipelotrichaceae bacterium]
MANFLTYLDWRGDLLFSRDPVNEIDLMIFAEISYADMDELFGDDRELTLADMTQRYVDAGINQSNLVYDPKPLLLKAAECARYRNVLICRYFNHIDAEADTQFSACTFRLNNRETVVAYRGTDNTVVGWREDFNFSYELETISQSLAVQYLNHTGGDRIWVCGHSKGGNLAMYAGSFCTPEIKAKIVNVSSFDGPGFLPEVLEEDGYNEIMPKAKLYLPDSSFFGLIMNQKAERTIVRSSEMGFNQHNPYSWKVRQNHFEKTNHLSVFSTYLDEVMDSWISQLSREERKNFIDNIFNAIEATGINTFNEMSKRKFETMNAIIKALSKTDSSEVKGMVDILGKLAGTGGSVLITDVKNFLGLNRDKEEKKTDEAAVKEEEESE